VMPMQPPLLA